MEFDPASIYSMSQVDLVLSPDSAFNPYACVLHFFQMFFEALACLRASSRDVIRRFNPCGRFKERIAVSPDEAFNRPLDF